MDNITFNQSVLQSAAEMHGRREHAIARCLRTDAIAYADVVTHNASLIAYTIAALITRVANKHHTTIVIVTVVILHQRVTTVVVAVEALCIPRGLMTAHFVILDNGIIATPRPESGSCLV